MTTARILPIKPDIKASIICLLAAKSEAIVGNASINHGRRTTPNMYIIIPITNPNEATNKYAAFLPMLIHQNKLS